MALSENDLQVHYSGGAANTSQAASLGGARSTAGGKRVKSQSWTDPSNVTGVTILAASGNPEGNGTLKWDQPTSALTWRPFGQLTFNGLVVSADGVYVLGNSSGYLAVQVVFASLPVGSTQDTNIAIANAVNQTYDNVSALDSLQGRVEYRCYYLVNTGGSLATDVRLWIKTDLTGPDVLNLALDPNGKNLSARGPLVDEVDSTSVLSGITFTKPLTYATGLSMGNLSSGDFYAFWMKRTIGFGNVIQTAKDLSVLAISAIA